jgi:hypothetical protein
VPCDSRQWTVSDVRHREARRIGAEGEARRTPAARNQSRRITAQQLQAGRGDLLLRPDLNYSNRPVRTRMPGGVGGDRPVTAGPYPDCADRDVCRCGLGFFGQSRASVAKPLGAIKLRTARLPASQSAAQTA